jgi:hypothetical protein
MLSRRSPAIICQGNAGAPASWLATKVLHEGTCSHLQFQMELLGTLLGLGKYEVKRVESLAISLAGCALAARRGTTDGSRKS